MENPNDQSPRPVSHAKYLHSVQRIGKICFWCGAVSTIVWVLCLLSGSSRTSVGMIIGLFYIPIAAFVSIICFIILVICLGAAFKYHLPIKDIIRTPLTGFLLSLSFLVCLPIYAFIGGLF